VTSKKGNRESGVGLAEAKGVGRNAKLTILNSCFAGLEIILRKKRVTLGKNIACDICLDDSLVSDEHASITRTDSGYVIEDLNSRNGITLNGRETHQRRLHKGDTIEIGGFRLKFFC
jgi:pSer/pThr/pTyr-binding forkhead associated (FHA) protein